MILSCWICVFWGLEQKNSEGVWFLFIELSCCICWVVVYLTNRSNLQMHLLNQEPAHFDSSNAPPIFFDYGPTFQVPGTCVKFCYSLHPMQIWTKTKHFMHCHVWNYCTGCMFFPPWTAWYLQLGIIKAGRESNTTSKPPNVDIICSITSHYSINLWNPHIWCLYKQLWKLIWYHRLVAFLAITWFHWSHALK